MTGHPPGPSPARRAALRAIERVERGERSEDALAAEAPAEARDRALCWHLVCGSLQRRLELDHVIAALSGRSLARLDAPVVAILRLALFELRHARTPPRAVVHDAVSLARSVGLARAAGFVNATLRAHAGAALAIPDRVAVSHPAWLLDRWTDRYGAEAALAWARRNNEPAPLGLAFHGPDEAARRALAERGIDLRPATAAGREVPGVWHVAGPTGRIADLPGAGRDFWVQDPAAAAVVDLVEAAPGWRVLDACAAPGGKTLRLAARGARVVAVDRSPERLLTLQRAVEGVGFEAAIVAHDWTTGPLPDGPPPFDAVLVDAPCTGLGTLRRHPEIRWRRNAGDPARAAQTQRSILTAAARHLRPGGVLVYAVCSAEPEEGAQVIAWALEADRDLQLDRTWCSAPPAADEDAFWAARLVRAG